MHEPQSLSALCSSLRASGTTPSNRKSPFLFGPRQAYPIEHHKKGSFLFHLALPIFYFSTGIIVFVSLGPQLYACIKQGKLKTLVATMALYKLPNSEAFNGTLPMTAPIVPYEEHAKYVCLNPWINTLVTFGIPWDNSGLSDGQVQKAHFVQRTGICYCLSLICFPQ